MNNQGDGSNPLNAMFQKHQQTSSLENPFNKQNIYNHAKPLKVTHYKPAPASKVPDPVVDNRWKRIEDKERLKEILEEPTYYYPKDVAFIILRHKKMGAENFNYDYYIVNPNTLDIFYYDTLTNDNGQMGTRRICDETISFTQNKSSNKLCLNIKALDKPIGFYLDGQDEQKVKRFDPKFMNSKFGLYVQEPIAEAKQALELIEQENQEKRTDNNSSGSEKGEKSEASDVGLV